MKYKTKEKIGSWTFMVPALLLFTLFFVVPACTAFYYAFTDWNGVSSVKNIIGFENFTEIFKNEELFATIPVTVKYALLNTGLLTVFSLVLALCINFKSRLVNVVRVIYYMPMLVGGICVGFIFKQIFAPVVNMDSGNMGILNALLVKLGMGELTRAWTGDPNTAMWAVLFTSLWQNLGYYAIIYLSRLQSIPAVLYEAAELDGANFWQRFRHITWPMLAPAFTINITLLIISSMRAFDVILALTGGGPGTSTLVINLAIFKQSFGAQRVGLGCAMSVLLSLVVFVITIALNVFLRRREKLE